MTGYFKKPMILDAVAETPHAVLEASAGTGKTYALEHLVIDVLLRTETTLEEILVVTFTEKAAAELRHRLRRKIREVHKAPDRATPDDFESYWAIDDAARRKLARASMSFDGASISTIHAFCQRILVENAFQNLRLFDQKLIDGRASFSRAFLDVLREHLAREEEPRAYLSAWLVEHELDALESLLYTCHTRRGELHPRFEPAALSRATTALSRIDLKPHNLKPALKRARLGGPTTDAILERIGLLRRALVLLQKKGDVPEFLETLAAEERRLGSFLPFVLERLEPAVTHQGRLRNVVDGIRSLQEALPTLESAIVQVFLPRVQAYLSHTKKRTGQLDFDDMLSMVRDSLDGPEGATLAQTIRDRFRYALIDEFQDTDQVQWEIFSRIFLDPASRLYVIGDPKQAIYGFRGADVHTYLTAKEEIVGVGGRTVHLTDNHRSARPMLDALNTLLDQTAERPFFTGEIRYDHPVRCGKPAFEGLAQGGELLSPIQLLEVLPSDEKLSPGSARNTLGRHIAEEITGLLSTPDTGLLFGQKLEPISAKDIYVLTRSGREGVEVANHLRRAKIPHAFYKQDGLFQTSEAREVRSLLYAIQDPHRRDRRFRAWQTPFFSIPLESLLDCRDLPGTHPLVETLFLWKALADAKEYTRLFSSIVADSGIVERELFSKSSERELTNYFHIFEVLLEEAAKTRATMPELLHTLSAFVDGRRYPDGEEGNVQRIESDRDAVQIMTMHKAKGLEAAVVFLYGGFDAVPSTAHLFHEGRRRCLFVGLNPPDAARTEEHEENQRLLYVSMTRAKARLYLPYFGFTEDDQRALQLRGAYGELAGALDRVRANIATMDGLFGLTTLEEAPRRAPLAAPEELAQAAGWRPPAHLLEPPRPKDELERLRRRAEGFVVTSYSRIKAAHGGYQGPDVGLDGVDTVVLDAPEDQLPPGAETGSFLHEVLELVSLDVVRAGRLREDPEARQLFDRLMARYGLADRYRAHAEELIERALCSPVALGERRLDAIAGADRIVREMEFLFPLPDGSGQAARRAGRGFIKGFIDLVIELDQRIYVADWKSDLLPEYGPAALFSHVDQNYRLQAELYTLAMVKLFGIRDAATFERRYGGTAYCFIRGMTPDGDGRDGVFFMRPTFEEVRLSEQRLREDDLVMRGGR